MLFSATALAEPPRLSLTDDGSRLRISDVGAAAPETIEITSNDAIPITWRRGTARSAELPLIVRPGVSDPVVLTLLKQPRSIVVQNRGVPMVAVDPAAYDRLATWRPTSSPRERQTTLLLAVAMGTTLLLATLTPRRTGLAVSAIAIAWGAGLALAGTNRPQLIERDEGGRHWYLATEAQTIAIANPEGEVLVPALRSERDLDRFHAQVIVDGNQSRLELTLGKGDKVAIQTSAR